MEYTLKKSNGFCNQLAEVDDKRGWEIRMRAAARALRLDRWTQLKFNGSIHANKQESVIKPLVERRRHRAEQSGGAEAKERRARREGKHGVFHPQRIQIKAKVSIPLPSLTQTS